MTDFLMEQVAIQRRNLVTICRFSLKSLIDRSCTDIVDEDAEELVNFCAVLEHILSHRIKSSQTWYGREGSRWFWDYIKAACCGIPHNCLSSIETMNPPRSHKGKGRVWIRMALMEKRLAEYLSTALQQPQLTRSVTQADVQLQYNEGRVQLRKHCKCLQNALQ